MSDNRIQSIKVDGGEGSFGFKGAFNLKTLKIRIDDGRIEISGHGEQDEAKPRLVIACSKETCGRLIRLLSKISAGRGPEIDRLIAQAAARIAHDAIKKKMGEMNLPDGQDMGQAMKNIGDIDPRDISMTDDEIAAIIDSLVD